MTEDLETLRKLVTIAEEGRRRAELELHDAREKFAREIDYISRLRTERCGTFHKRPIPLYAHDPLLAAVHRVAHGRRVCFEASQHALLGGVARADTYTISDLRYHQLPAEIQAENWWHLCAQTGLSEFLARVIYEGVDE